MNEDSAVQFLAARARKRTHREMSSSNHPSQMPWPQYGERRRPSAATHNHAHPLNLPRLPPARFHGDGFDFRRPVMSTSPQTENVIDLTNEPDSPPIQSSRNQSSVHSHRPRNHRPPRFGRNIMADVVDLENEADHTLGEEPSSSPEVQFVRATVRPQDTAPRSRNSTSRSALVDILRLRPPRFLGSRTAALEQEAFRQEIERRTRELIGRRPYHHRLDEFLFSGDNMDNVDLTVDVDVPDLDYEVPGFTIEDPTPPQSYTPPTPPPEGFTRTVAEDDVVVCPNCDHELGTGEGVKQQIWVAKQCGHVYCGECTFNRAKAKRSSQVSPSKTKPFSKCKVAGCERPVSSPKSMIQIFL